MNRRSFTLSLLAATAPMAITQTAVAQAQPGAIPAAQYLAMAAQGSMFLLQTAQDGYAKTGNPMVRRFARSEVNEQAMLSNRLARLTGARPAAAGPGGVVGGLVTAPFAIAGGLASAAGTLLGVPMTSDVQKADMAARLRAMPGGPAYDAEFVNAQIIGHNEAWAIHSSYAQSGDHPALRRIARNALPLIRLHLTQLARTQGHRAGPMG